MSSSAALVIHARISEAQIGQGPENIGAEKLARGRERKARARAANPEKYRAIRQRGMERERQGQAEYRKVNRARCLELQKAWREANREKRRAEKRASKISKRQTTIAELSVLQRGRCAICRLKLTDALHIDHIMPRKLGGSNDRSNLQLTCPTCNMVKNAKHPVDFARSRGLLL